jgi:hypothetical protein
VSERVILAVRFTPAAAAGQVRKAVGGFLRYVQHRDLHPTQPEARPKPEISGLLKYVAYRDRATTRAELFGPGGTLGNAERKAFASFVASALENSKPQIYQGRDGELHDRRRAVYRMVISPERAEGLDLRKLTVAALGRLETESGQTGLRWMAAVHRNTAHHHVHLVVAGMREDGAGGFARLDVTKPRLAAMKEALSQEIERQRSERVPSRAPASRQPVAGATAQAAAFAPLAALRVTAPDTIRAPRARHEFQQVGIAPVVALRAVARRYQRRMQRELEESYRQNQRELAA